MNSKAPRMDSIDFLRGLVMVIMALDHTRDYLVNAQIDPTDLSATTPALFFTRWITHFCAPVFVFLAGTGAFLGGSRGKTKKELSWFLFSRGLWLVFLEFTLVRFGWTFDLTYKFIFGQVIWVIGCSMLLLSLLIFLPTWLITVFGLIMIAAHNLFDTVTAESFGAWRWVWVVLHSPNNLQHSSGFSFFVAYPLIPWIGVMAAGYGFGQVTKLEKEVRRKVLISLGLSLTAAFLLLRFLNFYGDPQPWATQKDWLFTLFSFVNCDKYPPSLLFLLMTLGPAITLLGLLDREIKTLGQPFVIFGRVPLFYYLLHLPLLHSLAVILQYYNHGIISSLFSFQVRTDKDYGYSLPIVYVAWLGVVILLFPVCRWFAGVKQRRRDAWLSYL